MMMVVMMVVLIVGDNHKNNNDKWWMMNNYAWRLLLHSSQSHPSALQLDLKRDPTLIAFSKNDKTPLSSKWNSAALSMTSSGFQTTHLLPRKWWENRICFATIQQVHSGWWSDEMIFQNQSLPSFFVSDFSTPTAFQGSTSKVWKYATTVGFERIPVNLSSVTKPSEVWSIALKICSNLRTYEAFLLNLSKTKFSASLWAASSVSFKNMADMTRMTSHWESLWDRNGPRMS